MKYAVSFVALLAAACGSESGPRKITETREVSVKPDEEKIGATSADRFGNMFAKPGSDGMGQQGGGAATLPGPSHGAEDFAWTTPPGWSDLAPTQYRLVNLRPARNPEADCYLSEASGGLLTNVNRWRGQFGAPPIAQAAVAVLPKQKLLGLDAVRVEVEGSFTTMDQVKHDDFKLLGLVADAGDHLFFVKMTGPKAVVEQERAAFDAFVASIQAKAGVAHNMPPPAGGVAPPPAGDSGQKPAVARGKGFDPSKLQYDLPAGWVKEGDRPMRVATFKPANTKQCECYISLFPGDVGGLVSNVQRWRGQMGLGEMPEAEIPKLEKLTVLGKESTVVDLLGKLNDTMTGRTIESARFLGVICPLADWTLFVKMTGPEVEVTAAKDAFVAFCQSLRQQ